MKNEGKDIVIISMEFARENYLTGTYINSSDLNNFLVNNMHIKPNDPGRDALVATLFSQIFSSKNGFDYGMMGLEAYLGLLDYEDLKQARKDSLEARKESRTALFWTKVSFIMATAVGVAQIIITIYFSK